MKVNIIDDVNVQTYMQLLPVERFNWIKDVSNRSARVVMISATEDDNLIGYSVVVIGGKTETSCTLLYVYVRDKNREEGIGRKIINHTFAQVKAWGFKKLVASVMGRESSGILEVCSFKKMGMECILTYRGITLFESKVGGNLEKYLPLTKRVKKISQIGPAERKRYREEFLKKRYGNDVELDNSNLSRYYLSKEKEIIASMSINDASDGTIINTDTYISAREDAKIALPSMIVDLLIDNTERIRDDTKVIFTFRSDSNIEAMKDNFGIPDSETRILVYVLQ